MSKNKELTLEEIFEQLSEQNKALKEISTSINKKLKTNPKEIEREIGDFTTVLDEIKRNTHILKSLVLSSEIEVKRNELEKERREMEELRELYRNDDLEDVG